MTELIPNRLLFGIEFPLLRCKTAPNIDGSLSGWTDDHRLPMLGNIDGGRDYADAWACWNETGLFIACRVTGKRKALRCDPKSFWTGDNLRLCTDMRDARDNRRATRFCQQFYFLPTGGGPRGDRPVAGVNKFQRAREDAPSVAVEQLRVASRVTATEYVLEGNIPADCLNGFDPNEHRRIGFYYILEDADHGQQYLTVGDDLLWYADPSTWATAVLVD